MLYCLYRCHTAGLVFSWRSRILTLTHVAICFSKQLSVCIILASSKATLSSYCSLQRTFLSASMQVTLGQKMTSSVLATGMLVRCTATLPHESVVYCCEHCPTHNLTTSRVCPCSGRMASFMALTRAGQANCSSTMASEPSCWTITISSRLHFQ